MSRYMDDSPRERARLNRAWIRATVAERGWTEHIELLAEAAVARGYSTWFHFQVIMDLPCDPTDSHAITRYLLATQSRINETARV
jgi:hypothetical protein